jgi:hypothetical protein
MKTIIAFCITLLLISFESSGQVKSKRITKLTNIESSYPYWSPFSQIVMIWIILISIL